MELPPEHPYVQEDAALRAKLAALAEQQRVLAIELRETGAQLLEEFGKWLERRRREG